MLGQSLQYDVITYWPISYLENNVTIPVSTRVWGGGVDGIIISFVAILCIHTEI